MFVMLLVVFIFLIICLSVVVMVVLFIFISVFFVVVRNGRVRVILVIGEMKVNFVVKG